MEKMQAINLEHLDYKIDNRLILNDLNVEFEASKFYSIVGPNGSGKSTFVKAIANDIKLDSGQVLVFSKLREKISNKEFANDISILRQFNEFSENIKVYDLLAYGRSINKHWFEGLNQKDEKIINEMIELTSINNLIERDIQTLSGGEKQRILLAMALISQPKVLILDEPTNHLDIKYQIEILKIIRKLNLETGMSVICIIHDINLALKFSDYLIMIKDGHVAYQGDPKTFLTSAIIEEIFGVKNKLYNSEHQLHVDFIIE